MWFASRAEQIARRRPEGEAIDEGLRVSVSHRTGELARVYRPIAHEVPASTSSRLHSACRGRPGDSSHLPDETGTYRARRADQPGIPFEETTVDHESCWRTARANWRRVSRKLGASVSTCQALYVTGLVDNLVELAIVADDPGEGATGDRATVAARDRRFPGQRPELRSSSGIPKVTVEFYVGRVLRHDGHAAP